MKILMIIFVISAILVGCGKVSDDKGGGWIMVRSPISGICYEAYDRGLMELRVFSLGKEIKCPSADQLK